MASPDQPSRPYVELAVSASDWVVLCGRASLLLQAILLDERLVHSVLDFSALFRDSMTLAVKSMSGDAQALQAVDAAVAILRTRGGVTAH